MKNRNPSLEELLFALGKQEGKVWVKQQLFNIKALEYVKGTEIVLLGGDKFTSEGWKESTFQYNTIKRKVLGDN